MTNIEEQLDKRGFLCYTNKGVSMMPLLRQDKDVMVIYKQVEDFKKNDAVLFKRANGQYVLHRITKVLSDGHFYIVGDNCIRGEVVPQAQILGVLKEVKRGKKVVSVDDFWYKVYVFFVPAHRLCLRVRQPCRRVLAKVYRKFFPRKD